MKLSIAIMKSLLMASVVAAMAPGLNGDDWPQWRGKSRDGKSTETGLLDKWPEKGPRLVWQTQGLGGGFSSPSVARGCVFIIVSDTANQEKLVALDLKDGSQKWQTPIGKVGENKGPQYPGSRSTPSIDGTYVYALGSDGDLVCLKAEDGKVEWKTQLKTEFEGRPGQWAYTESPLVDGDALICSPGGSKATIVSLDKKTGKVLWQSTTSEGDDASYSSPVIAEINGVKQYVLFLAKGLVGIEAATGKVLWRYDKTADQAANVQTPIVKDSLVYTGASRVGGSLAKVAADNASATQVYFNKTLPTGMGGAILVDSYLYGSSGSTLMCVEYDTGKTLWQQRMPAACALCYADGKLYLHGEDNDLIVVAANPKEYTELGKVTPPSAPDRGRSKAWTHPVIADGKLIVHDSGAVWCYDIKADR